jgi:hypothetical protein
MAGITFTPISGGKGSRKPLNEIDQEIIDSVEEALEYCLTNPEMRLETMPFVNRAEAEKWLKDARAYAYQRPETAGGRLVVSGNPARAKGAKKDTDPHVLRITVAPFIASADGDDESTE